ncbi:MAG: peptidoglycan editing factor PgeF [Acidobacteriota bacterium]|nr:peptidoglycan editing factor PgeF [Acidobacteriota bacterium]
MLTKSLPGTRVNILRGDSLGKIPWLVHGFSTRTGGFSEAYGGKSLNLSFTSRDSRSAVERNRNLFLKGIGPSVKSWPLIRLRQMHSDIIHCISGSTQRELTGDGLITRTPEILLSIQTADCLPIILADTKRRAVGIFHAGWRGTIKRIVEKGAGEMRRYFGTVPRDIKAAIGPGIHGCCYEVGPEIRESFESQFSYADKLFREVEESDPVREKYPMLFLTARAPGHSDLPKKIFLDLPEANREQLRAIGVPARNITVSPLCTACHTDLLFSYRAEKGMTGRMMGVVGIKT